ncbi:MAG TPA: hypothetical protein VL122_04015 [Nitrospirota bacterium]|nr:hypothetical protein [Nitrospirota bacterium]
MRNAGRYITLIVLLLVCPSLARGDEICFIPSMALKEEYNSNIMLVPEANGVIKDYITTLSPGFDLTDKTDRLDSLLSLRLDRLQYSKYDYLSATNQSYNGTVRYAATPLFTLSAGAGYTRIANLSLYTGSAYSPSVGTVSSGGNSSPPPVPVTSPPTAGNSNSGGVIIASPALPLVALPVQSTTASMSTGYQLTEKTSLLSQYQYVGSSYQQPYYRATSYDVQAGLTTDFSEYLPRVKGLLNTEYSQYLLPDSRTINVAGSIGFSYAVSETWSVLAQGGIRRTESEQFLNTWVPNGNPGSSTLVRERLNNIAWGQVGNLSLNYQGEYMDAHLMYTKDLTLASGLQSATDENDLQIAATYKISYELSVSLSAEYTTYQSPEQNAAVVVNQRDISISPVIRYDFSRDLALEATYQQIRIDYHTENTEANRQSYFLRLTARFPYCSSSQYK